MQLDTLPRLAGEYFRALSDSKTGLRYGEPVPRATLSVAAVPIDAAALERFRSFVGSAEPFPLVFAYVLAQPAHVHLINQPDFPVRSMGLVHASNRIRRLGAVDTRQPLALELAVTDDREKRRSREFTLATTLSQRGTRVLEIESVYVTRVRGAPRIEAPQAAPEEPPAGEVRATLDFAGHFGRRYARVSGDWNPIHLARWLARPFGFRRPIAHGMGALARIDAELARGGAPAQELAVRFRRTIDLPGSTRLLTAGDGRFALVDSQGRWLLEGERR
jgi:hypothetical protein